MQEETTVEEYTTKNAIVRIHHPVLTEEERAKRMEAIEKAAIRVILSARRAEALKQQRLAAEQA